MNIAMLILRLGIGLTVAAHGAQKLFGLFGGHGLSGTARFLESLGFRPGRPYAWLLGLAETLGGAGLALGLLTPLAAAAVAGVMVTAAVAVHIRQGFFAERGGFEYLLTLALASMAIAFAGPGRYSLDRALDWHLAGTSWGLAAVVIALVTASLTLADRAAVERSRRMPDSGRPTRMAA